MRLRNNKDHPLVVELRPTVLVGPGEVIEVPDDTHVIGLEPVEPERPAPAGKSAKARPETSEGA